MSNTLLTIDMITKEALRLAHEKATFIGTINRQFDDSFGNEGAKIGDTLRIRYPSQYTRRTGSRIMAVQDNVQLSTALTVATQDGVDIKFNSRERALDLDEYVSLHLEPAIAVLISNIEADVLVGCTKSTYNFAGTAGTAVSSLTAPGAGRTRLNQNLAPKSARAVQFDSGTMASIVSGTAAYFNPSNAISEQFREGPDCTHGDGRLLRERARLVDGEYDLGHALDHEAERLHLHERADEPEHHLAHRLVRRRGNEVHHRQRERRSPGDEAGIRPIEAVHRYRRNRCLDLHVQPPIFISGARQNVTGIGTTTSTQTVTWLGSPNSTYTLGLMYHKDAFTFATAPLPLMAASEKCSRRTFDGLSVRVWSGLGHP
jgi:hypothetical protein